jgi:hypothetical protein
MSLLEFTADGTMVHINTLNTDSEIVVSDDVYNAADIQIRGYKYNISGSNININPLTSSMRAEGHSEQLVNNYDGTFSMRDSSGVLQPILVKSITDGSLSYLHWALTFDHLFLVHPERSVTKTNLFDATETPVNDIGTNPVRYPKIDVYDNNTAFIAYIDVDTSKGVLSKIDFCNQTEEIVYEIERNWADYGADLWLDTVSFITKVEYDNIVYVVVCFYLYNSNPPDEDRLKFLIYNYTDDSVYESDTFYFSDVNNELESLSYAYTTPKIIDGKLLTTWDARRWSDVTPSPLPSICTFPTFIVDCSNSEIRRVDDYTVDTANYWPDAGFWGSGIDYDAGIYYFGLEDWESYGAGSALGAIIKINLATETTSLHTTTNTYYPYVIQGTENPYVVEFKFSSLKDHQLRSLPSLGLIDSGWTSPHSFSRGSWVMDECNNRLWIYQEPGSELISKTTSGAKTLQVNWGAGGTPYDCSSGEIVNLAMLAGNMMLYIRSYTYSPSCSQNEWYLLQEPIPCP